MATVFAVGLLTAAPAAAAPLWNLDMHHAPTNFAPGGSGQYWFDVNNIGDSASSGPITLTIRLRGGLTRASLTTSSSPAWSCPGSAGQTTIVCTTNDPIARHSLARNLILSANLAAGASGDRFASAKLEGGGALAPASAVELTHASAEGAGFGVVEDSFLADSFAADGLTPVRRAGAHPDQVVVGLDLNSLATTPEQFSPAGNIRHFQIELPPGFLGNPTAVGQCSPAQLTVGACPGSSQVGRVELATGPSSASGGPKTYSQPVFNMQSPRGVLADLAFAIAGNPVHVKFSLDPANGYAILASAADVNETESLFDLKMTLWGVPADHSHDSERCGGVGLGGIDTGSECSTDIEARPFLTVPSQCGVDQSIALRNYDSWQHSGVFGPEIASPLPGQATECDRPRFEPELDVGPTVSQADTPTGLAVHLELPQNENPNALGTPPAKRVVVTLPEGMTLSPAATAGLSACSPAQIGLGTNEPIACPDASRIGTVTLSTPLLPKRLEGFIYLTSQGVNPFHSLLAIYLVVRDTEERGVLLKVPGRLDLDPASGQITARFDDLPQLPFADLSLGFRNGERAPLVNPPSCGTKTIHVEVSSYAQPDAPVDLSNTYQVTEGPNSTPCPQSPASRPFAPQMLAGTLNPSAAAFSPFVFRVSREDSDQELGAVTIDLPPGLSATLAGIPLCPDSALASISAAEGTGQAELDHLSCPPASEIGTATAGAGAGSGPIYLPGKVFLAGPYKGAPFSLVTVVPAVAGPLDLGTAAVRMAVYVDPTTAQLRVVSDQLPTILSGVPLDLRVLRLDLNRPQFTLNPTSCEPMSVSGTIASPLGTAAPVSNRFQVGDCANLAFKPRLSLRFSGAAARNGHPTVTALLRPRASEANPRLAALLLPRGTFLDQTHIRGVCTRARFAASACPADSIYGRVEAWSPLLNRPLQGHLYMRESARRLPDLAVDLDGQVHLVLAGHLDTPHARVRASFGQLPDVPFSRLQLVLRGGKHGLLVDSEGLCAKRRYATASLVAHNGKRDRIHPRVTATCGKNGRSARPGSLALAAETPTRREYVTSLEQICKPGAQATQRAMKGVRDDVQAERDAVAAAKFARGASIFGRTVSQIAQVPRPPADTARLRKWFVYLDRQQRYLAEITAHLRAGQTIKAQRATARFIHNGNLANNVVLAFGFDYCSFRFSRFG